MRLTESICKNLYEEDETVEVEETETAPSSDIEKEYFDFLKSEVEKYCTNGYCDVYWDYQDEETLADTVAEKIKDMEVDEFIVDNLTQQIEEDAWNNDWYTEYEQELASNIYNDTPEELKDFAADRDVWEDLEQAGYKGINDGLAEHIEDVEVPVELLIVTPEEANYDMGSIIRAYGSYDDPDVPSYLDDEIDTSYYDNGLTFLIHQQGHTVKEVLERRMLGKKSDNTFVESVYEELINNNAEAMTGLFVCGKVPVSELGALMKSGVTIKQNAMMGLVNVWNGSGSTLDIKPEKDIVVPAEYIDINHSGYSIAEIYGMSTGDYDTGVFTPTNAQPELVSEDITKTVQEVGKELEEAE